VAAGRDGRPDGRGLMRRAVLGLLVLLAGAGTAGAQEGAEVSRALRGGACPVALPAWATAPELHAWGRICAGDVADMRVSTGADDGAGCEAAEAARAWPDSRLLSPRFVQLISARAPWLSAPAQPAIRIRCARIDGPLRLEDETLPQALRIEQSRLPAGAVLTGMQIGRDLSFEGSALGGPGLVAGGLSVAGTLVLRDGVFASVGLEAASVGAGLDASGARVGGRFDADGLMVGGQPVAGRGRDLGGPEPFGRLGGRRGPDAGGGACRACQPVGGADRRSDAVAGPGHEPGLAAGLEPCAAQPSGGVAAGADARKLAARGWHGASGRSSGVPL
jgi:hypothetical protein